MKTKLAILALTFLPKKWISKWIGKWANSQMSRWIIPYFAKQFNINLSEAEKAVTDYFSLTDFFTRRLKKGIRSIDPHPFAIISPVDGTVAQFGQIEQGKLIQAKGITYSVLELLGDEAHHHHFKNGSYITIYLSPKDYHRIHYPTSGNVIEGCYIPGQLFPVNRIGVEGYPGLFAKNERIISYIKGERVDTALVKVGATIVGGIRTFYNDRFCTNQRGAIVERVSVNNHHVQKGDECGLFEFGSTVVLLFNHPLRFDKNLTIGQAVLMGQRIAEY